MRQGTAVVWVAYQKANSPRSKDGLEKETLEARGWVEKLVQETRRREWGSEQGPCVGEEDKGDTGAEEGESSGIDG